MRRRRSPRASAAAPFRAALVAAVLALGAWGCELLSGVDDLEVGRGDGAGAAGEVSSGGSGGIPPASGGGGAAGGACGAEVDVDTDPEHCGSCGRSCRGGACVSGKCQPVLLAAGAPGVTSIAVTRSHIAWNSYVGDQVYWAKKSGSLPLAFEARTAETPRDVELDDTTLFWTNQLATAPELVTAALDPAAAPSPVDTAAKAGYGIALDSAGDVYWTTLGDATTPGSVSRCTPSCGASAADQPKQTSGPKLPLAVAVDATHAYWTTVAGGTLQRIAKDAIGTAVDPEELTTPLPDSGIMIATDDDADVVYWTGHETGTLWSLDKSATLPAAPAAVATGYPKATAIALDAEHVYFTYFGRVATCDLAEPVGGVARVPRGGGPVEDVAVEQLCPHAVVVDDDFVYWGSFTNGIVYRLVK